MGDMLSQAEIDALLNGSSFNGMGTADNNQELLTPQEIDALGEIGNISMGTSATTLFTLLGQKVIITTPKVSVTTWDELSENYRTPFVAVKVEYTNGLSGSNLLIMKEQDVRIITDLMMGGDGSSVGGDLSDLHLSAISEAMNQMVGSSSTALSSMFDKRIEISPPKAFMMHFKNGETYMDLSASQKIVIIAFKIIVGNLIDSEIMQILPISFAKNLVANLLNLDAGGAKDIIPEVSKPWLHEPQNQQEMLSSTPQQPSYGHGEAPGQRTSAYERDYGYDQPAEYDTGSENKQRRGPLNVQPAHFQPFDESKIMLERKNISLIMDVPLQVTVELGRTQKLIKDILEFGPGSIIELDKLAGEPVDILVNGKPIAKGEVVVIDESFGVRITDIIHPSKRL
ncbi:MAG: flagellar motor switch phosphatase FliY [Ruminiclostridium sp.]|nr:flagellar motor switch phosphatase FliY [Ruminiclostridium sp.]